MRIDEEKVTKFILDSNLVSRSDLDVLTKKAKEILEKEFKGMSINKL